MKCNNCFCNLLFLSMTGHRVPTLKPRGSNVFFYSATKHAVTALTEGVRRELRAMDSKVRVTVSMICRYYACSFHNYTIYQPLDCLHQIFSLHLSQSISPRLVRTEFSARLRKNSEVKPVYDTVGDVCTVCKVDETNSNAHSMHMHACPQSPSQISNRW